MTKYILASGSPRRKELLEQVGLQFEVMIAEGEEITTKSNPWEIVEELSSQKAEEIVLRLQDNKDEAVIIAADTIVAYGTQIMGKPKDKEAARDMIKQLQDNVHQVYTGVTVIYMKKDVVSRKKTFNEKTQVYLYPMSEEQIDEYLNTHADGTLQYIWEGKAGAYGIQDAFGKKYIKGISGDYYNVMGLPVARLFHELNSKW